jgi:hypothetical protein
MLAVVEIFGQLLGAELRRGVATPPA